MTVSHLFAACVLGVGTLASVAWAHEQSVATRPVPPVVLSGADIGFRMTGRRGDAPVGELVVRVDGEWKRVEFAFGLKPISK